MKDLPPLFSRLLREYRLFCTSIFAVFLLAACQDNEQSQIAPNAYALPMTQSSQDHAQAIGDALGVQNAKPAQNKDGEVLLQVQANPLIYSDGGLLVDLDGNVTLGGNAQLNQIQWRQTAGPQAQLLNPTLEQTQVVLPVVATATDLEFALLAADVEGHVAEARTRIRVLPLGSPSLVTEAVVALQSGLATVTLTLPAPPEAPVVLFYNTDDGSALAGRDYMPVQGQVTLNEGNPQTQVEIPLPSSRGAASDSYFRFRYALAPDRAEWQSLYVVLTKEGTGTSNQPVEKPKPVEPQPSEPADSDIPAIYSITYAASPGGHIQGEAEQNIPSGQGGTPVVARADDGYRFVAWSDGLTTATRVDEALKDGMLFSAEFRKAELWRNSGHNGELSVSAGHSSATVSWPVEADRIYSLVITHDPATELDNYSVYGGITLNNVTPPLQLTELNTNEPVYIALERDGVLHAWSSFVPRVAGVDGAVTSLAVDVDGTRYVGGNFTWAGPSTGGGVALTVEGSAHVLAGPEIDGIVHAVIADDHGGWYIGGQFTRVDGQERHSLAHIDAEGRLSDWMPIVQGTAEASFPTEVKALVRHRGVIYAGGNFTGSARDATRNYLAAFDSQGQLLPWNPRVNGRVYALAVNEDAIYVGGHFTHAGSEPRNYLAAFDTQGQLLPWDPKASRSDNYWPLILALTVDHGVIYVGGMFTQIGNENRNYLAALDTDGQLLPWNPKVNAAVRTFAVDKGIVYVGGDFGQAGGEDRNGLAAFDDQGQVLPWTPAIIRSYNNPAKVYALAVDNGVIYAGGGFAKSGSESRGGLAAFDDSGQLLRWNPGTNADVFALAIDHGVVYAGGNFTNVGGEARLHLAAFEREGSLLPWTASADRRVDAIVIDQDAVYVGGSFLRAGGESRSRLAAFDKQGQLLPWNPGASSFVSALALDQGVIYAGGGFTRAGGAYREHLAAFDKQGHPLPWNPRADNNVAALVIDQGTIFVGGSFTAAGDEARSHLAAFDTDGQLLPWNPRVNSTVSSLVLEQGAIYAGGSFNQSGGESRINLAAFDLQGQLLPWNPGTDFSVNALATDQGVIYAGGGFGQAGGEPRGGLAAFDTKGQLLSWNPKMIKIYSGGRAAVHALAVDQGVVHAGGHFTHAGGEARSNLAAFDKEGRLVSAKQVRDE